MRCLIIGGGGMLGHKLVQVLGEKFDVWTTLRKNYELYSNYKIIEKKRIFGNVDIENIEKVKNIIESIKPHVIINAVGVIKQLPTSKDVIKVLTLNSIFPHQLAEISKENQVRLINISTDCVFSGEKGDYKETDIADAADLYGRSKNLGEVVGDNCLTLRTSIIGRELQTSNSLVEWFFSNRGKTVNGYKNAVFSGFTTIIFAEIIADLIEHHPSLNGLYHVSSKPINKLELLKLLKKHYRIKIVIEPFEEFKIDRSLNSDRFRQATNLTPAGWEEMIKKMAADPTPYDKWRK